MIGKIILHLSSSLSGHLSRSFGLLDQAVCPGAPGEYNGGELPNKIVVSLVGVERETAAGTSFSYQVSGDRLKKTGHAWQLNLYVMVSALFAEKQYAEGLSLLSESLRFIQQNTAFYIPALQQKLVIEPVNISFTEQANLWGILGGSYYPSVLCKVRIVLIGADTVVGTAVPVTQKETGI